MPYDFKTQLETGKAGEWVMKQYHDPFYRITKTGKGGEMRGVDFIFQSEKRDWNVEIKTDFKAQRYGNIIIETMSSDAPYKPGWAITTQSDVLIFYLWHLSEVLYFLTPQMKAKVDWWKLRFGESAKIPNGTYNTIGIKLPLADARQAAYTIRSPVGPYWMKENYKLWHQKYRR